MQSRLSGQSALLVTALAVVLAASGLWLMPRALDAWHWLCAQDNPAALTDLGLASGLSPERLQSELQTALDADDVDLANSLLTLAEQQGLAVPPSLRQRVDDATTPAATAARNAREFYQGAKDGHGTTGAGLAGVVASDLSGVGDVRDLIHETRKIANGEEPDRLVLGLAAVGLAVTGATVVTLGAAMPSRAGVSTIKVAAKSGRLSKPLATQLGHLVQEAVDTKAVALAGSAAARLDVTAARTAAHSAIRPASLARLRSVAEDAASIGRRTGVRGTHDAFALARSSEELQRVARLAERRGLATRAVLKVLGRGALVLRSSALMLASWVMAAIGYLGLVLLVAASIVKRAAHMTLWALRQTR